MAVSIDVRYIGLNVSEIIVDWCKTNDNYKLLPIVELTKAQYDFLQNISEKYIFNIPDDEGEVEVYKTGELLFTVTINTQN